MKECFKCGEAKPLSEFYKHKGMKDGRLNKCKECNKADVSRNYRANIAHYKEYEKRRSLLPHRVEAREKYAKTANGREAGNRGSKAWADRNRIKRGASTLVGNAVRDGRIFKPNFCTNCGNSPKRLHGHHEDYSKPLDVVWLCPGCHKQRHKEMVLDGIDPC